MREKNKPPMREQVTLRLPKDLYAKLKQEADEKGLDIKSIIVLALWDFVDVAQE